MSQNLSIHGYPYDPLLLPTRQRKKTVQEKLAFLPSVSLTKRQLCDVELILDGSFSPLDGFLDEENYHSVLSKMHLSKGALWPIPIVLDIDEVEHYAIGMEIALRDLYGVPLAILTISSIYKPDKTKEAKLVYNTINTEHSGVNYLLNHTGTYYIGGPLQKISNIIRYDFLRWRHTPQELQMWFLKNKWKKIIGFQTRNPIHKAHYSLMKETAKQLGAKVLIHPSVGMTKDGDIDYVTRIKSYIQLYELYAKPFGKLSLLPLAMRMAGPREALWHALIRKNYGCTHFIVGRDHAGPGKNSRGTPFYGAYDAQELTLRYQNELGIEIIPVKEMVYVEQKKRYLFVDKITKHDTQKTISGTEFRRMISNNERIPTWFSFPEITSIIRKGVIRQQRRGVTLFFTGLPCSGKSTIATMLYYKLLEIQERNITLLDGDVVRQNLSKGLGFTKKDRNENIKRIGFVASEITKHGGIAICSAIAPHKESRDINRKLISQTGAYIEIYVSTPLAICMKRDIKGLYKKAKLGMLQGLTGLDDIYDPPLKPEITIDTTKLTPQQCVNKIIRFLQKNQPSIFVS